MVRNCIGGIAAIAILALGVLASPSRAEIVFTLGNNPQPDEENILFGTPETGNPINGETNMSNVGVTFSSLTDTLEQKAKGQADIFAADGLLNDITMVVPNGTYTDAILNPQNGNGTVSVTVVANDGTFKFDYGVGSGQNFLTITAINGETISSVNLNDPDGFADLKQPRISGVGGGGPPQNVPEPGTLALFAGIAAPVLGLVARRKMQ